MGEWERKEVVSNLSLVMEEFSVVMGLNFCVVAVRWRKDGGEVESGLVMVAGMVD